MVEWHIGKSHQICVQCTKNFEENEELVSEILENEAYEIVRRDYCANCWQTQVSEKAKVVAPHWKSHFHIGHKAKVNLANPELLYNLFLRLNQSEKESNRYYAYFLSLHLMRKRILTFDNIKVENEQEIMVLKPGQKKYGEEEVEVISPVLTEEEIQVYEEKMKELLSSGSIE